jgi:hypothetical protein
MIKKILMSLFIFTIAFGQIANAQAVDILNTPKNECIDAAKVIASQIFDDLQKGLITKVVDNVIDEIGFSWDETRRITARNQYLSTLNIIFMNSPKVSSYGNLEGFDLIEVGFIPGSSRYFRHIYMTYHENNVLIWQFRFYVNSKGKVKLNYIEWSDKNPFEYLGAAEMFI